MRMQSQGELWRGPAKHASGVVIRQVTEVTVESCPSCKSSARGLGDKEETQEHTNSHGRMSKMLALMVVSWKGGSEA